MENSLIRGLSPGGSVESSSTSERVICGGLVEQSVMEGRTMEDAIFASNTISRKRWCARRKEEREILSKLKMSKVNVA